VTPNAALDVLRLDALRLIAGELIFLSGVVACILYALRGKRADISALYFGLAATLYGLRLVTELDFLRAAFPGTPWREIDAGITFVVGMPFVLFFGSTIARAFPRVTKGFISAQALLAIAAISVMLLQRNMATMWLLNALLAAALVVVYMWIGLSQRLDGNRESIVLRAGLIVMGSFVLYQNLSSIQLLPQRGFLEPIGMIFLLCAVGYVSAIRTLRTEENWIAIQKELEIARQIQLSILPRELPNTTSVRVAARYVPMTEVAGDFYDFLIVDRNRIGILVADVAGHGVPAALIASMVKVAIAAQQPHAGDPARVLSGMNQILCGKLQGQFVTAAYLFIDAEAGRMRYSAAAHPRLLWQRNNGQSVESVEQNGLMLGFLSRSEYSYTEREIGSNDRFLLYTDGALEAANAAEEFFGEARLMNQLRQARGESADDCAASLLHDVGRWAGHGAGRSQEDDLTLLVVDCRPAG
jgi:sigma-B regulation protein RsbU (phosphoserine phosphatase)